MLQLLNVNGNDDDDDGHVCSEATSCESVRITSHLRVKQSRAREFSLSTRHNGQHQRLQQQQQQRRISTVNHVVHQRTGTHR